MSFQQIIIVTEVPRDSSYLVIKDNTQAYDSVTNPTGWGCPGGPSSLGDVINIIVQMQYFGEQPITVLQSAMTGNIDTALKITYTLKDGVYLIHTLYGVTSSDSFSVIGKIITVSSTGSGFDDEWGGVSYISDSNDLNKIYKIKSVDRTLGKIELYDTWTGSQDDGYGQLIKYYENITRILVLNCGEKNLVSDIAAMSTSQENCDCKKTCDLMDKVLLKLAAQTAFSCGDYVKAHNAAILLCDKQQTFQPCSTC